MQGHTRKHPIKQEHIHSKYEEGSISADDFTKEACEEMRLPIWAISLAGLRYRDGLTQQKLGDLIDVSPKNISNMERGRRPIGKDIAKRLAKVFKTDYRDFL